ncbi:MAG: hypothetical protein J6386_23000 [Candidatus Synoicihabitans palmerolidicus]|nr:hypothetical protein [Candidatus Synoicihabitans palmerolidicus]
MIGSRGGEQARFGWGLEGGGDGGLEERAVVAEAVERGAEADGQGLYDVGDERELVAVEGDESVLAEFELGGPTCDGAGRGFGGVEGGGREDSSGEIVDAPTVEAAGDEQAALGEEFVHNDFDRAGGIPAIRGPRGVGNVLGSKSAAGFDLGEDMVGETTFGSGEFTNPLTGSAGAASTVRPGWKCSKADRDSAGVVEAVSGVSSETP